MDNPNLAQKTKEPKIAKNIMAEDTPLTRHAAKPLTYGCANAQKVARTKEQNANL
jgi:hypothetical protein